MERMKGKIRDVLHSKLRKLILPIVVGLFLAVYGEFSYLTERENESFQYKMHRQLAKSIRQEIENIENLTFQFIANFELNKILYQYIESPELYQIAPFNNIFSAFLESQTRAHPLLRDAALFDLNEPKRKALTMSDNLTQSILLELRSSSTFKSIRNQDGRFFLDSETVFSINGEKYLLSGRLIKKIDGEREIGILICLLRTDRLSEILNSDLYVDVEPMESSVGNYFNMLISSSGRILASPLKGHVGRNIQEVFHTPWQQPDGQNSKVFEGVWRDQKIYLRSGSLEGIPIFLLEVSTLPPIGYRNLLMLFAGIILIGVGLFQIRNLKEQNFFSYDEEASKQFEKLPPREKEILLLLAQGYSNKEIAYQLHLQEQTVKNYLHSLYSKLGIHDRVSAALFVNKLKRDTL